MNYRVYVTRKGWIFATLQEASRCAENYRKKTGVFVAIERTQAAVTHTYKMEG